MTEYERDLLYKEMKEIIYNLIHVPTNIFTPTYKYTVNCNDDISFICAGYWSSQAYKELKTRELRAVIENDCGLLLPLYENNIIVITDEQLKSLVTFYKLKGDATC